MIKVKLFANIDMHDGVEVLDGSLSGVVTCIRDDKKNLVNDRVKADKIVWLGDFKENTARAGNIIYKTTSSALSEKYKPTFEGKQQFRRNHLSAVITAKIGFPLSIEVYNDEFKTKVNGKITITPAEKNPITSEAIEEKLSKTKDSPFIFSNIVYDIEPNSFVPISEVNKLKQIILEKMEEFYTKEYDTTEEQVRIKSLNDEHNSIINIKFKENKTDIFLYKYNEKIDYSSYHPDRVYLDYQLVLKQPELISRLSYIGDIFIALPTNLKGVLGDVIKENIKSWIRQVKGFLIPNICYFEIFKEYPDVKLIGDFQLNIFNNFAINAYRKLGLTGYTLSLELDENDARKLDLRDATIIANGSIPAITSEYCVVGSFAGGFTATNPCRKPCSISNDYYLIDQNGERLNVLCNPINCSSRLLKKYKNNFDFEHVHPSRVRYNLV